jgi:hypothetical protein
MGNATHIEVPMPLRTLTLALAAIVAFAAPSFAEEAESIETVGREFLGIMKERGFADARYQSITGSEESFAIKGFKGSKKDAIGGVTSFSIDSLTVEGLQPDDRWTRAQAVRADGIRLSAGKTDYDFGTIYANKAGILDIDGSRPSAAFATMILKAASVSVDGKTAFKADEAYASADKWIGEYGVPGRLDITVKGVISGGALSLISPDAGAAFGSGLVPAEVRVKSSLAEIRDELSLSAEVSAQGHGVWKAEATVVNFDKGLFQAWLDLDNPDDKRSPERQKKFDDTYAKERADIGIKSLAITLTGLDWLPKDIRLQIASSPYVAAASAVIGNSSSDSLKRALDAVVGGASTFELDGYTRAPVRIGDAQLGKADAFAPLMFRFSAK